MSETLKNLVQAFIGESQARNRYTIYAKTAKKEGYEQISAIFLETAEQEAEHAKWLLRMIQDLKGDLNNLEVNAGAELNLSNTKDNLLSAINGENYETSSMYPKFAEIAEKEGYPEIANRLRAIAKAEEHHRDRYQKLLNELENNSFFEKEEEIYWICRKCGYIHYGKTAPQECPSCGHPQAYFQRQAEIY